MRPPHVKFMSLCDCFDKKDYHLRAGGNKNRTQHQLNWTGDESTIYLQATQGRR